MNCRAIPKSFSFTERIAACRSSLDLPETRICSPWIWVWTFAPVALMNFVSYLAFSSEMPVETITGWRT